MLFLSVSKHLLSSDTVVTVQSNCTITGVSYLLISDTWYRIREATHNAQCCFPRDIEITLSLLRTEN